MLDRVLFCPFEALLHVEVVVAVHSDSWDFITTSEEISVMGSSVDGGTHSVEIILADKETREFPKTSHVSCFSDLTLIGGTISVHSNSYVGFLGVL
jgi:hypothetical protein